MRPFGALFDCADITQVARLRDLAAQHADDSVLASALQEAAETIELPGLKCVEIEDFKGQLRKVKTMLTQHSTTLMGMENTRCVTDSRTLKALQAFILDTMDAAEIPDHAGVIGADGKHGVAEMLANVVADAEIELTPKE